MAIDFEKVTYVDGETVIGADNLNDIQDAILDLDSSKVEKEQGKGLSTNDYTNEEKAKVDAAAQATTATTIGPAPIVTFDASATDMPLKGLTVDIEPVQDLHGYDNPWPGGGGKNLLPLNGNQSRREVTYTVQADGGIKIVGTSTAMDGYMFFPSNDVKNVPTGQYIASITGSGTGFDAINIQYYRDSIAVAYGKTISIDVIEETVENYIRLRVPAQTTFDCVVYPMLRLATETDATFSPYSNVCPITGWTGCNVTRTGKNLFLQKYAGRTNNGITFALADDGSFSITGKATNTAYYMSTSVLNNPLNATFLKAGTYILGKTNHKGVRYVANDISHGVSLGEAYNDSDLIITLAQDALVSVNVRVDVSDLTYDGEVLYFQIESGSTATAYEPYAGTTYPITFPASAGTVYGGTLTFNQDGSKELADDCRMLILDDTTQVISVGISSVGNRQYAEFAISSGTYYGIISCSHYQPIRMSSQYGEITTNSAMTRFYIYDSRFTSAEVVKEILGASPVQVLLKKTNAIPYNVIDDTEIITLRGENNIWADCGDVTVTYGAYLETVKAHAERLGDSILSAIAPLEATYTASRTYSVGEFLFVGTKFFKVTAAIGSGDTINPGTNVTQTTVAAQLMELAGN